MTAEEFAQCLADMQSAGIIRSGHGHVQDAAERLGVSPRTILHFSKHGTGGSAMIRTDLACAALLKGLEPYPAEQRLAEE